MKHATKLTLTTTQINALAAFTGTQEEGLDCTQLARAYGWSKRRAAGALVSLFSKGIVTADNGYQLTQLGKRLLKKCA